MLRRAPPAFTSQVRVDPAWLEMAQGITLVRERLGRAEDRLDPRSRRDVLADRPVAGVDANRETHAELTAAIAAAVEEPRA